MDAQEVERRKQEFLRWERNLDAKERLVFRCAVGLEILMVLFPPKVATVSFFGGTQSNPIGYSFIFENPMAGGFMSVVEVHISFLRLLVQMIVVAVAAYFLIRYFKEQRMGSPVPVDAYGAASVPKTEPPLQTEEPSGPPIESIP